MYVRNMVGIHGTVLFTVYLGAAVLCSFRTSFPAWDFSPATQKSKDRKEDPTNRSLPAISRQMGSLAQTRKHILSKKN